LGLKAINLLNDMRRGAGPKVIHLLNNYWESQMTAIRQGGYHSGAFHVARGITEGDISSPEIFNIVVDAVLIGSRKFRETRKR
jgi:hypothetical protein